MVTEEWGGRRREGSSGKNIPVIELYGRYRVLRKEIAFPCYSRRYWEKASLLNIFCWLPVLPRKKFTTFPLPFVNN